MPLRFFNELIDEGFYFCRIGISQEIVFRMSFYDGIGIEPVSAVDALDKEFRSSLKLRHPCLSFVFGELRQEFHSLLKFVGQ